MTGHWVQHADGSRIFPEGACGYCQADPPQPLFDWHCARCRARMLVACPDKAMRQSWINRWRAKGEGEMIAAIIEHLRDIHAS